MVLFEHIFEELSALWHMCCGSPASFSKPTESPIQHEVRSTAQWSPGPPRRTMAPAIVAAVSPSNICTLPSIIEYRVGILVVVVGPDRAERVVVHKSFMS